MHLLKLLLGQHQAVHLLLSRGAWDGDPANQRGSSLLLFLGLEKWNPSLRSFKTQFKDNTTRTHLDEGGDGEGRKI